MCDRLLLKYELGLRLSAVKGLGFWVWGFRSIAIAPLGGCGFMMLTYNFNWHLGEIEVFRV